MVPVRGFAVAFALLMVATALAGCLGGTKDDASSGASVGLRDPSPVATAPTGDDVETEVVQQGKATVERLTAASPPTWIKGRFWKFEMLERINETADKNRTLTLAVTDDGATFRVATDQRDLAVEDVLLHDRFFLGEFQKSDLAYLMGGVPIPMYQWPLKDGATWTAVDHRERQVSYRVAHAPSLEIGAAAFQGFVVSGIYNGTLLYEYSYVPEAKWFSSYELYDPDLNTDNKRVMKLRLLETGTGFAGEVLEVTTTPLYRRQTKNSVEWASVGPRQTFAVPSGLTSLFVYLDLHAGNGFWSDVYGYTNATLLRPDNTLALWAHRLTVAPTAWDAYGAAAGNFCNPPSAAAPAKDVLNRACIHPVTGPQGNPWRPYHTNRTAYLASPPAGDWTMLYTHVSTGLNINARLGAIGLTETAVKPGA